jgi:ribosome-associated protein
MDTQKIPDLSSEFIFQTSRSGGPGGQNVNKVSSKVELYFNVQNSELLNDVQKEQLFEKYANKISQEKVLRLVCQTERSQLKNKELVVEKFYDLLQKAFYIEKKRKATKPGKGAVEDRIKEKKVRAGVKQGRQKVKSDE